MCVCVCIYILSPLGNSKSNETFYFYEQNTVFGVYKADLFFTKKYILIFPYVIYAICGFNIRDSRSPLATWQLILNKTLV